MKYGEVVSVRLSPEDVMAAVDIVRNSPAYTPGMGLAQVVKWAMVYAFEALRQSGAVPRRDGFEYAEMVKPFKQDSKVSRQRRGAVGYGMQLVERQSHALDTPLKLPTQLEPQPQQEEFNTDTDEQDNGLVIPQQVRVLAPCGPNDVRVISSRLIDRDENLTVEERAKWLLYSPARAAAYVYMSEAQVHEAEALILTIWPEYPRLY